MKQRIELVAKKMEIRLSEKELFWIEVGIKWICVLMVFVLYSVGLWTISENRVEKRAAAEYKVQLQNYISERDAEDARKAAMPLSLQEQIDLEANSLAKVLYGVKDNSTDDLRTYCWCVFNRVDNPNPIFGSTLDEVINQPNQWMRYSADNDVLSKLKEIAKEELTVWHEGTGRPCSNEYVYMDWTSNDIILRTDFVATRSTRYWRY